ncbi:MAG: GYD domain-containing protein [Chloroflexota bacterium]|jgi:uncharacterized protein with GYD domain
MPAYIVLINLTDQGIRTIKDDPNRVDQAERIAQKEGVRIVTEWWTMGQYDAVMVAEAPNDETMNRFLLGAGRQGNIRTTTLRAFTREEIDTILKGLA